MKSSTDMVPIGAAVALLHARYPDVTHSSLRFLEREGLLRSVRTEGGHRLYSPDDLARVALIKRWQKQGSSLEEVRRRLVSRDAMPDPSTLASAFLDFALDRKLEDAQHLLLQADTDGLDPQIGFFDVLQPALVRVGELWESGRLSVAQEKEITEVCREIVTEVTLRHTPDFPSGPLLLAACVEGERHEIGLRMVYGILRMDGFRARYLGPDVATRFLVDAVQANHPHAILLSATLETSFYSCREVMEALGTLYQPESPVPTIFGGKVALTRAAELESLGGTPLAHWDLRGYLQESIRIPA
ncbi:MAG TPA: MerR family transcriptional regulator [Thermomicrobiales bacterium]|nr:MerR family transcriptional regulator [Thermomicrobiales bacterium]